VIDTPITEHGSGWVSVRPSAVEPIVEFMTFNFAMQRWPQIINSAAKTHYMLAAR